MAFVEFAGQKCTIEPTGSRIDDGSIHMLRNAGLEGLSKEPNALCTGANGGYQALGLAVRATAQRGRALLLGYDMRYVNGRSNWHSDHQTHTAETWYSNVYVKPFNSIKVIPGMEVINCTPGSMLKVYPIKTLEEAFP